MEILKVAKAGSLESNDILIMIAPNSEEGIKLSLDSIVIKQFGEDIKNTILETLKELSVNRAVVKAEDKGALDFTIKARVKTAVNRAIDKGIGE